MRLLGSILFAAILAIGTAQFVPKIVGGSSADITSYPYALSLHYLRFHICGATAIGAYWAVTAAHCLDNGYPPAALKLRAGSTFRSSGGALLECQRFVIHPQFNRRFMSYDVGVVRTLEAIPISTFAQLPPSGLQLPTLTPVSVVGWGLTESSTGSETLRRVKIPIVSDAKCRAEWREYFSDVTFCAGRVGKDSCNGDSGGPLVFSRTPNPLFFWRKVYVLYGIVSFGPGTCGGDIPGVYTKVSHPGVLGFVRNVTGIYW